MFVSCDICGKKIYRSPANLAKSKSGKHFCSKSCQTLWRNNSFIEEKSANWINGVRTYRNILLRSGKETECALCGVSDQKLLVVHHKDHQRTHNQINNLTWLCFNCHYLVHHDKDLDNKIKEL